MSKFTDLQIEADKFVADVEATTKAMAGKTTEITTVVTTANTSGWGNWNPASGVVAVYAVSFPPEERTYSFDTFHLGVTPEELRAQIAIVLAKLDELQKQVQELTNGTKKPKRKSKPKKEIPARLQDILDENKK